MTRRTRLLVLGVGLLVVFGAANAGKLLVVSRPLVRPDAVISLSSHEWERLPATARQAAANPTAVVLLTLPEAPTPYNCHDCAGRVGRLERLGVPSERVHVLPLTAPGTHGEALAARAYAREMPVHRLLIVTTPYHTRRALATFESVFEGSGIEIGVEPATASSPAKPEQWWATPYDRAYVAYEWAARVYYAVRYGVMPWS